MLTAVIVTYNRTEIHIRIKLLHLIYSQREWLQSML